MNSTNEHCATNAIFVGDLLFGVLTLVISLASTNDLMNTSIEMDYAPLRMSKSKEFVKFMFTFVHTIFLYTIFYVTLEITLQPVLVH